MLRIAWRMLRERPASVIATFVALWIAVAVVTACGAMLESGIRYHGPVQRYAAAPVLVATTDVRITRGSGEDQDTESHPLATRAQLPATLTDRIAAAPGVRAAVGDVSAPGRATVGDRSVAVETHPWSAARLTPYALQIGKTPSGGTVVVDRALADGLHVRPGSRVRLDTATGARVFRVAGIAGARDPSRQAATVFTTDADAATVAGHGRK